MLNNVSRLLTDTRSIATPGEAHKVISAKEKLRRIVIVERRLTHYRVPFFNHLRALLEKEGIELQLLVSEGTEIEAQKKDLGHLDWAIPIRAHHMFGTNLCWQPFGDYARDADLVIVVHENKLLYNLWLMFVRRPRRLAFWGHGRNMQSNKPGGWKELFKRWTVNKVDWWFAYTEMSVGLVEQAGFPRRRITDVENSADTNEMVSQCKRVSDKHWQQLRKRYRLNDGPIGLCLGSLYAEKRLDFLIDAALRIRRRVPDFQLLVVGAGNEQGKIESAAAQHAWICYAGPLRGLDKATVLVYADVLLSPGAVGLGILDSFVSGTPMFTTDCGKHGPEISYLESGRNGIITIDDLDAYADAVVDALNDRTMLAELSVGARAGASKYTVENMAQKFKAGVLACLSS